MIYKNYLYSIKYIYIFVLFIFTLVNIASKFTHEWFYSFGLGGEPISLFISEKKSVYEVGEWVVYKPFKEHITSIEEIVESDPQDFRYKSISGRTILMTEIIGVPLLMSPQLGFILEFIKTFNGVIVIYFIPLSILYFSNDHRMVEIILGYLKNKKRGK